MIDKVIDSLNTNEEEQNMPINLQVEEIETQAERLIENHESFRIIGVAGKMISSVEILEKIIERKGMKCRIFTYGRTAAIGASFFGGVLGVLGVASAIGVAAHNIATYDPDYEIAKHYVDNMIFVDYKKVN